MSYAIANLKELDDMAVQYGLAPAIEARFAREVLGCEITGISYQRVAPNARHPLSHRHGRQEEIYVVVSGGGRANLDGEIRELRQWDALRVAPETTRGFEAGPDGVELLAIGAPSTGPGDADLAPGWWSD